MTATSSTETTLEAIDPRQLRNTFGTFATGVTVVTTTGADGVPHGATVNAFTAVSLDPPLAQVTLTRQSKAAKYLENSHFAINILASDQLDVAMHFAGRPMEQDPDFVLDGDVPILNGSAAVLECKPWNIYDGGDHIIVVGEVTRLDYTTKPPLLFYSGKFREVGNFCEGTPWDHSADSLSSGWFDGAKCFKKFS
ncbi:flavin reductase family protein [Micrococcoides hystricis]|uniref:Flavin reductase family protein n=1 Tax=Micrococcoides hystricis TaxID=1572761 RepID=A0ABV6P7V4_9MICC